MAYFPRGLFKASFLLSSIFVIASCLNSNEPEKYGSLEGSVDVSSGAKAEVRIYSASDPAIAVDSMITGTDGNFVFDNLPAGTYIVAAESGDSLAAILWEVSVGASGVLSPVALNLEAIRWVPLTLDIKDSIQTVYFYDPEIEVKMDETGKWFVKHIPGGERHLVYIVTRTGDASAIRPYYIQFLENEMKLSFVPTSEHPNANSQNTETFLEFGPGVYHARLSGIKDGLNMTYVTELIFDDTGGLAKNVWREIDLRNGDTVVDGGLESRYRWRISKDTLYFDGGVFDNHGSRDYSDSEKVRFDVGDNSLFLFFPDDDGYYGWSETFKKMREPYCFWRCGVEEKLLATDSIKPGYYVSNPFSRTDSDNSKDIRVSELNLLADGKAVFTDYVRSITPAGQASLFISTPDTSLWRATADSLVFTGHSGDGANDPDAPYLYYFKNGFLKILPIQDGQPLLPVKKYHYATVPFDTDTF